MKRIEKLLLFLIILVTIYSRFSFLTDVPHGFFCDEAAIGYNAYKLLTTGRDEYGVSWPFFFRSFGDYRNPVPIYLNIPTIALFGLSDFSIRFTAAFFGSLTVLVVFLIGRKIGDFWTGFFGALFLATSQWHIHLSRVGLEYVYFPFFFSLAILFWLFRDRKIFLYLAFLFFGVSLYTYYPAWLMIPLFLAWLIIISLKEIFLTKRKFLIGLIVFLICSIPIVVGIKSGQALTRWQKVQTKEGTFSEKIKKVAGTYADHFGPDFLFTKGDIDFPGHFITRHSIRGTGEVYWFLQPLLILGLYRVFFKRRKGEKNLSFILVLLLLYPLGSALTDSGPFATRSILGVVPFSLLPALGISLLIEEAKPKTKNLVIFTCLGLAIIFWTRFLNIYFIKYPLYSSDFWGWQYGPKEIIPYFMEKQKDYEQLFLEVQFNGPEIFIPFFSVDQCQKCFLGGLDRLDINKKQLFAVTPPTLGTFRKIRPFSFKEKKRIFYPDGSVAFLIIEPLTTGQSF